MMGVFHDDRTVVFALARSAASHSHISVHVGAEVCDISM